MEVVIHGTKGGYRILYKTPGAPSIGSDIRNNVSSEAALGRSAYSIAFAANGCVFTKYIIIRDTLRSDATGFIAFSLFLSLNKELLNGGADVKAILDELSNHYVDKYVRNNNINKGETDIIQEDWYFVNDILGRKTEQDRSRNDFEIQAGSKEAALVFYEDDFKLQEYFSKPFQEEYNGYKQILLINGELRYSSADLLNAIRNSGEELKVDLRNDPYYLNNYNPGRGLSITSNDKPRSDGKKNNVIMAKEKVEIRYTKEYYRPIEEIGTLSNPNSDIFKYLDIRGNQIFIKWDELSSSLIPIEETITFDIRDWKGNLVKDVEITCKSDNERKSIISNTIIFRGEEIGQRWTISTKKGDNLFSDTIKMVPQNKSYVEIILKECKKVKFQGELKTESNSKYFPDIKISLREKSVNKSPNTEIEFINDEINEKFRVIAVYSEGNNNFFGEKEFCPKDTIDGIPVSIELNERAPHQKRPTYFVDVGKHGTASAGYSHEEDGGNIKVKEAKGYSFIGFQLDKNNKPDNYDGTLVAKYEKKLSNRGRALFAGITVGGIVIVVVAVSILIEKGWMVERGQPAQNNPLKDHQLDTSYIQAYIAGDSLILETLSRYKKTMGVEQAVLTSSIDSAINKRRFVNEWNFNELKKLSYYSAQEGFKTAIFNIDSTQYNKVRARLPNVSSWNLNQIADSINTVLNSSKPVAENLGEVEEESKKEKRKDPQKEVAQTTKPGQRSEENIVSPPANINNSKEDAKKLQSGTITKYELQSWKTAGRNKYNKSIDLYLKFWDIVTSNQKSDYDKVLSEIKVDNTLKNSELRNFLVKICASSDAFEKYNAIRGKSACKSINELRNKIK